MRKDFMSGLLQRLVSPPGSPEWLDEFIDFCEATSADQWCMDVVRTKDGSGNCLFGHLATFAEARGDKLSEAWDSFEGHWATTYMVYPVNDGENPAYRQETAKDRCIAYLRALRDGTEKTTVQLWNEMG